MNRTVQNRRQSGFRPTCFQRVARLPLFGTAAATFSRVQGTVKREAKTMKSMTTKLMMTAGALAIATGIASAQQYRADIPFAFRAGDRVLAAGTYVVRVKEEQSP